MSISERKPIAFNSLWDEAEYSPHKDDRTCIIRHDSHHGKILNYLDDNGCGAHPIEVIAASVMLNKIQVKRATRLLNYAFTHAGLHKVWCEGENCFFAET